MSDLYVELYCDREVDGVRYGCTTRKATRAEVLEALGVNPDDLERFRSHMESECCERVGATHVKVDTSLHNAMWRVLDALTGWSDDE